MASRCRWRPGGADPNAVIFHDAGLRVGEGVVGDGIKHMFTTSAGDIWVAYPVSRDHLRAQSVGDAFIAYLANGWADFVA